jgi:hypothetical protein
VQVDYFQPQAMHVDDEYAVDKNMTGANHGLYTLYRQIPPGRQHFYFTWQSDKTVLYLQSRSDDLVRGATRDRAQPPAVVVGGGYGVPGAKLTDLIGARCGWEFARRGGGIVLLF